MRKNDAINFAVENLKAGKLILCPTDSIYGISCDATNAEAVEKIVALKGRDANKSFIVLLNSDRMLNQCFNEIPAIVWDLVDFSDQPLTIVMEEGKYVAPNVLNEDGSLGMRYIKNGAMNDILRKFNKPIVSTSPNRSAQATPMNFSAIDNHIKEGVDFIFPAELAEEMSNKPSKIIRIKTNSEVEILRK